MDQEVRRVFHALWTKAAGQPKYAKGEWMKIEAALNELFELRKTRDRLLKLLNDKAEVADKSQS